MADNADSVVISKLRSNSSTDVALIRLLATEITSTCYTLQETPYTQKTLTVHMLCTTIHCSVYMLCTKIRET